MTRKPNLFCKIALIACCGLFCGVIQAQAQFLGYTSPQTVQQTLATNVSCTGSGTAQDFSVANLGQNQHFATLSVSNGLADAISAEIDGYDAAGTVITVSDSIVSNGGGGSPGTPVSVYASGYYPQTKVRVKCLTSTPTFTLTYSGTSSTNVQISGSYQVAQQIKNVGFAANANFAPTFQTPFGSSDALIRAQYKTAAVAGSTVLVSCTSPIGTGYSVLSFTLANDQLAHTFKLPPEKCYLLTVAYTSGGATAGTISLDIMFQQPGTANVEVGNYVHITGTTATNVKIADSGVVTTLTIGTPAAGTISFFDLASASCTGTPATNVVSVITALAGGAPTSFRLNLFFQNGICVKASAAMDLTVGYQ